jgi:hypothetical protein
VAAILGNIITPIDRTARDATPPIIGVDLGTPPPQARLVLDEPQPLHFGDEPVSIPSPASHLLRSMDSLDAALDVALVSIDVLLSQAPSMTSLAISGSAATSIDDGQPPAQDDQTASGLRGPRTSKKAFPIAPEPVPEEDEPTGVDSEAASSGAASGGSSIWEPSPQLSDLLARAFGLDLTALARALDQLMDEGGVLGGGLLKRMAEIDLSCWLTATAVATAAYELARREMRRGRLGTEWAACPELLMDTETEE